MWIVNLEANSNGSHNDHRADHITTVPDGWAMIPEGFELPASFPFGDITAEEVTYYRKVEVEPGVTEDRPYTMMTVTAMTEGEVPEAPEPEPTWNEQMEEHVAELDETTAALEDAICEMDEANEERMAAIEDALCEMDMG